jgi:hypothetical protein
MTVHNPDENWIRVWADEPSVGRRNPCNSFKRPRKKNHNLGLSRIWKFIFAIQQKQTNSVAWVRERTIPIEHRRLLAKLVPTFEDRGVIHSQHDGFLRPYSRISRSEPSSSSTVLTRLNGPRSRSTTSQNMWQCRESNTSLWVCSQELWSLDHRELKSSFARTA